MIQKAATEYICYTDGWHPTVNPSSRMVIHHFRFVELLHGSQGILNEFPRRRGGCTFRFLRFYKRNFQIYELPTSFEFVPWWLPASPETAQLYLFSCYERALQEKATLMKEEVDVLARLLSSLQECVHSNDELTLGEVLNLVNEQYYRDILPEMPSLYLNSLTKDPLRHLFAQVLRQYVAGKKLDALLSTWAAQSNVDGFTMLAVGHTHEGKIYRVSWSQREKNLAFILFDPITGKPTARRIPTDTHWLADELDAGRMIPGSRLTSLIEVLLRSAGKHVQHFGNNYGRVKEIASILSESGFPIDFPPEEITFLEDDADSWHIAVFDNHQQTYPLHLLDMMCCTPQTKKALHGYIQRSLEQRFPVVFIPGENLNETILARGA
ncbi:MAG: hypothetical protein WCD86_14300 [Ktedonobacteraceae bacterium]